ncbi:MAG: TspO/MBR family protein [Patescibacteria group bacterium]
MKLKLNDFLKLVVSVAVCQTVGIGGVFFAGPAVSSSWYLSLKQPPLNPPGWIFSPVWITLYFLMGAAAFLIWRAGWKRKKVKIALGVFAAQLFLNGLWSIIFFGGQNQSWALADIVVLWLALVWTIVVFYKISKSAAILLAPYILWVSFAAYLNYAIWLLN